VIPEIVHQPGEALILDWGKLRDVVDPNTGKKRCLWAFVGVLGFSRYMMVRLVWSNETQVTLQALILHIKPVLWYPTPNKGKSHEKALSAAQFSSISGSI
jgi:transposase